MPKTASQRKIQSASEHLVTTTRTAERDHFLANLACFGLEKVVRENISLLHLRAFYLVTWLRSYRHFFSGLWDKLYMARPPENHIGHGLPSHNPL
jgi:hypothetical protein